MGVHLRGKNRNINSFRTLDIDEQNVGVCKSPNPYTSKKKKKVIIFKHVIILKKKWQYSAA